MKRQAHFYSLPRAVQHRFIESTRGVGAPAPVFVRLHQSRSHLLWALGAVLTLILWIVFASLGYGDLESSLALAPTPALGVHVIFAAVLVACALTAQSKSWVARRTPFLTGTFAFPSGVVIARLSNLTIHSIDDLSDVRVNGTNVDVVIGGQTFSFSGNDAAHAAQGAETLKSARERFLQAKAANDIRQLLLLDPLQDSGVPNPLAPTEPWAPPVFMKRWAKVLIVLAGGFLLGWAVFWMRNTWSARALFAAAMAADTTSAYSAYLERGGKRPEVEAILLPRAQLREAQAKGTVQAIEEYIKQHPQTRIGPEVTAVHRQALLNALEKAKQAGTLSALNELEKKHEGHPLIQHELLAAKQAVFDKALQEFRAQAAATEELLPFVQRLMAYTRAHGPEVKVRFRPKYTQNYEHIEDIVRKSPYYTGESLLPGQYFRGKYVLEREQKVGQQLVERLQKAFPKDIVHFKLGKQLSDDPGELPKVEVPTLFIEHSVTFSGGFVGLKRQGMYMGMTLAYVATFRIPGQKDDQLVYRIRLWRAPKQELIDSAKDAEELYETLADDGYDTFAREYLEYWFKKP